MFFIGKIQSFAGYISRTESVTGDLIFFGTHDDFIKSVEPLGVARGEVGAPSEMPEDEVREQNIEVLEE